jgi:phosphoglycerate dehydrogenase-like enzyme
LDALGAHAPAGVEVLLADDTTDLETIDFLVAGSVYPQLLERVPALTRLAVVQVLSAGTDWIEPYVPPQATLCNARGTRDGPVAEWVMGALLGVSTRLLECARIHTWTKRQLVDLGGWTVLIVGMGSIGHRVGQYLAPLGTEVVGVASRAREDLHGIDELPALLPRADAVVVLAPLTDATRGLVGAPELAAMHDGAVLINAARGAVVDTDALVAEVSTGRLQAVLDVTDPEPLPDDHPLWSAPGVVSITPHIAGDSPAGNARAAELAGEQLARFCAGEELHNIVRRGIG